MQLRCFRRKLLLIFAVLATLTATAAMAAADSVADFYRNRSISMIIGYSVGGGYDAYARLLARYVGKHIPGEPSIVPQQMTGAGSLRAANYMFSVAPKDRAVLGTFSRSMGIAPLLGLVGTIYGLVILFGSMGQTVDNAKFAQGISLALNATLLGLLIAIPTLAAWSYYNKKVETFAVEMESLCDEFLRKHYRTEEGATLQIADANNG